MELEEDPISACAFLLSQIERLNNDINLSRDDRRRKLLLAAVDFAAKSQRLDAQIRRDFRDRALELLVNFEDQPQVRAWFSDIDAPDLMTVDSFSDDESRIVRPRADVVIVTVIRVERQAVLKVFGGRDAKRGKFHIGTREVFHLPISRSERPGPRPLDVYLVMVGEPRNVPCANVCRDILHHIDAGCMLLLGIAGGDRTANIQQGDVLGVESVFYVEAGKRRSAPRVGKRSYIRRRAFERPRPWMEPFFRLSKSLFGTELFFEPELIVENLPRSSKNFMNEFMLASAEARRLFDDALACYSSDEFLPGSNDLRPDFRYRHPTSILCGEKVVVDGSVGEARSAFNRQIAGVDMESYGFAATCNYQSKPWFIFRGISDYADPKKDDAKHVSAAVAAAVTAKLFLTKTYKTAAELDKEL